MHLSILSTNTGQILYAGKTNTWSTAYIKVLFLLLSYLLPNAF